MFYFMEDERVVGIRIDIDFLVMYFVNDLTTGCLFHLFESLRSSDSKRVESFYKMKIGKKM